MAMKVAMELITPKKAEVWLNANVHNRRLRAGLVEKYAADMVAGLWTNCPEPISFYEDNTIADGQHRLWAVVESGVAVWFPVCRGLTRADGVNINTAVGRSVVDAAKISGRDPDLTNELVAACRAVAEGKHGSSKATSHGAKLAHVEQHRDAVAWALEMAPRQRNLRNSIVAGAIARAFLHEQTNLARLQRFCEVFGRGFQEDSSESAAIALRNYFIRDGSSPLMVAGTWRDTFLKSQNAIWHFMRQRQLVVIKAIADERYPLPSTKRR
jgi:hypothetical protein